MSPKQEQEKIKEQAAEIARLKAELEAANKKLEEAEKARPASKSRQQALAGLEMPEEGTSWTGCFQGSESEVPQRRSVLHPDALEDGR